MALSSSLVAMGFLSSSPEIFVPFAVTVLPALFVAGLFTVVRLVARHGRWPEVDSPAERFGGFLAFWGTTASMMWADAVVGSACALLLTVLFYRYQRWRFADHDARLRQPAQ